MSPRDSYTVEPIPPMRRFSLDAGYLGRRRHIVHGLLEVDVTEARGLIRELERTTGERVSFTAFVIKCLSDAVQRHPHVHAYRDWRNRLVIFDEVNVNSLMEVEMDGRKVPVPHTFRNTGLRDLLDIHRELRVAQREPQATAESRFMRWFLYLPAILRRSFYWVVMRFPLSFRRYSSSVLVTAVGMFGRGSGWAITMPNFTLTVAVGGLARKPGVVGDQIQIREYLNLTVSFDHDIVDGAPAARFAHAFQSLLEQAHGLRELRRPSDSKTGEQV